MFNERGKGGDFERPERVVETNLYGWTQAEAMRGDS